MKIKNLPLYGAFLALTGLISSPAFSTQFPLSSFKLPDNVVLQVGGFDAYQGKSQNIGIDGLIGDHFSVTKHNDQNALIGLGYFIDGYDIQNVRLLYGLNAFYLFETSVKGKVTQEDLFTNLSYRYTINNYPIYLAGRALINSSSDMYTYTVDLGLGANIIQARSFKEHSLDDGVTIPDYAYSSHTSTAFSATVGAGVRFNNVIHCMALEVGYRFFYLGEGNLSKTTPELLNTLKTGNSYANALVFTLS